MSSTQGPQAHSAPPGPGVAPQVWPRRPEFLTDTTLCPACFSAIAITPLPTALDGSAGPVCTVCGLDLSAPEATSVLEAGRAVVFAESQRRDLLTRMRHAQAEREGAVARARATVAPLPPFHPQASAPLQPFHAPQPHPAAQQAFASGPHIPAQGNTVATGYPGEQPVQPPQPPVAEQHPAEPAKPRRSSIQILMLTVGVILVSIMALFFVLLAYLVASLEVRSLLTGAASVVVFGVAVLLLRRRLQGTAEGIAALAVVLFLLDLWIIRANGVFGSGDIDGWLYVGLSACVLTALLAIGAHALPLRTLSLSAVLIGPIAWFALVQGVLVDVDAWTRAWTALSAVGLGSLVWTRISRPLERAILRVGGMLATAVAAFCAFGAFPELAAGSSIAFTVLAGVWFCMLAAAPGFSSAGGADAAAPVRMDGWAALAAIGLGLAASGAGISLFLRGNIEDTFVWLPATVTALAALIVASLARVPRLDRLAPALRLAAVLPLGVAGLASAPAFAFSVAASAWGATTMPFTVAAFGSPANPLAEMGIESPLALLSVSGIVFATLATLGRAPGWSWIPAGIAGVGLIAASAMIGQPVASVACLGILAAALLAGMALLKPSRLRFVIGSLFAAAVVVFCTIGLSSTATFPVTAIASVALLAAARQVIVLTTARVAAALAPVAAGATAVTLILSARMVPVWFETVTGATPGTGAPALWMALAALSVYACIPFTAHRLARAESAVLAAAAALAAGSGLAELYGADSPVLLLVVLIASAVASMVWQVIARVAAWPERFVAAAIAPLSTVWAVDLAWREFGPTLPLGVAAADSAGVILAATIVLLAAIGPVLFRRNNGRIGTSPARSAWDGALAVTAVIVLVSVSIRPELGWLTLVLLAVSAVLVASGDGDVVSGTSQRRHLAWLGLPLAVAGLWLGLARADATVIELYTLPVAGLLLAILGVIVARRPISGVLVEPGRTTLFAAALAVGLCPSAVVATGAEPLRAILVLGVSAILVGASALLPPLFRGLRVRVILWLTGVAGAVLVGLGRAALHPDGVSIPFESWSAAGAVLLLAAGLLWHSKRQVPVVLASVAVVASVLVLSLPTAGAILTSGVDAWRGLLVLAVVCCVVVAASVRDEFSPELRWASTACAVVLAGVLLATGIADPFELATAPVAIALLVGGAVRLTRDSSRGSWAELGPGLVILLVPSLVANIGFSNELWRVVALGVVALLVFGGGLALKLQAPTLIGAVVLVSHALAQFWPWISGLYGVVPWWLWVGIGGVILIVSAATLEGRIRDLKAVARGISSLR